jgi:hypothetical protein
LVADEKLYLFANLLRNPVLFQVAAEMMPPQLLDPVSDMVWILLWRAALNAAKAQPNGLLPDDDKAARIIIELETRKAAQEDPVNVYPEHLAELFGLEASPDAPARAGFFNWAYGLDPRELVETHAKNLLLRLLEERLVHSELCRLADRLSAPLVPVSLQPFLDRVEQHRAKLQALSTPRPGVPVLELGNKPVLELVTTGSSFLDRFMDGGQAGGEMYTVMGPTGAGKSTLGGQVFMDSALEQQRLHMETGRPLAYWHYVCLEMTSELKMRLWAHAARVDVNTFLKNEPLSTSADPSTYKKYETEVHRAAAAVGDPIEGERERLAAAEAKWLAHPNFFVHDFSGSQPGVGSGGVDEIARILDQEVREGRPVAGVVIDYAGLAVARLIESGRAHREDEYKLLNGFGQSVVNKICARFNCAAWVLHQLHGEMAKRAPTARYHHSDAQGARNFANAAWFAFQIGNKDDATQCVTIWCTKSRRTRGTNDPALVRVDGALATLVDENSRYTISSVDRGVIVPRNFESKFVKPAGYGPTQARKAPPRADARDVEGA